MWKLKLQLHGGSSSGSSSSSYTPTEEEKRLWRLQGDYQEAAMPYAQDLLEYSKNLLDKSLGVAQVDFTQLNNESQGLIDTAQNGVLGLTNNYSDVASNLSNLANGVLPTSYTDNMQQVINNQVSTAMGSKLNSLANSGVLNSSITQNAMNDISKNAANTMAEMYNTNIGTVSNLYNSQADVYGNMNSVYGQLDSMASDKVTAAAAAQEAAQQPAMNLLNAATGTSSNNTSAIGALKGTGTTTSTTSSSSGGLLSGLFGTAATYAGSYYGSQCFSGETPIAMADGSFRNIRDVEVGNKVLSLDKDGAIVVDEVTEVRVTPNRSDIILIDFESKDAAGKVVTDYVVTTQSQPFLNAAGEWVWIQDLEHLTKMWGYNDVNSEVKIISVEQVRGEPITVYDLGLKENDNYIAAGLVAHAIFKDF